VVRGSRCESSWNRATVKTTGANALRVKAYFAFFVQCESQRDGGCLLLSSYLQDPRRGPAELNFSQMGSFDSKLLHSLDRVLASACDGQGALIQGGEW